MHESFPGVMNMAVNTFLKITSSCNTSFVTVQNGQNANSNDRIPFVVDILSNI